MKKIIFLCFFVASFLFFIVYNNIQKEDKKLISSGLAEISFSFPSSLEEKIVESSIDVIKKRLAFISHNDQVKIQRNGRDVVFSFVKSEDITDDDVLFLNTELLSNFNLKFYDTFNGAGKALIVPDSTGNLGDGKALKLTAISPVPFLTFQSKDISRFYMDTMKINGEDVFVLRVYLNMKSRILENKSDIFSQKGGGVIYYRFNGNSSGVLYVNQKISDHFTIPLADDGYWERFLEMQYKYPLPQKINFN